MDDKPQKQVEIVATLLDQAGVPVPDEAMSKLGEMYRGAEEARRQLRSVRLGETEPMIIFVSEPEDGDA